MDVFISWSGNRSKAVAELLRKWLKQVLQGTQPWISSQDIESGGLWLADINEKLKDSATGIVCLTEDNKTAPWIHFEAGALAKGLTKARVCTFLIDLRPADIGNPLGQFQHTLPERDSMWKLVQTLNERLTGPSHLDESTLKGTFDVFWPIFEEEFGKALKENAASEPAKARTQESYLVEILENTRALNQRMDMLEALERGGAEYAVARGLVPRWVGTGEGGLGAASRIYRVNPETDAIIKNVLARIELGKPSPSDDDKNKPKKKDEPK